MNQAQFRRIKNDQGFIAALDQSGGSSPKVLELYGISQDSYDTEDKMYELVHQMRTRILTSSSFSQDHILGAILFEVTLDSEIEGLTTDKYLWQTKQIVPFLKVDSGLAKEQNGVQMMKPIDDLNDKLAKATEGVVFGTKMRSVIQLANEEGIKNVVEQQFDYARKIMATGLVPIIEPEISIDSQEKQHAEHILKPLIAQYLGQLSEDDNVMLKLSLPETADFYQEFTNHPRVVRVVALSGGYKRDEANIKLAQNHGVVASFSRALAEGLSAGQSDEEFDTTLRHTIESIYQASIS